MSSKNLLLDYLNKNNVSIDSDYITDNLTRKSKNNPFREYTVNHLLELDILSFLKEKKVIVRKLVNRRIVEKEAINFSEIVKLNITLPNLLSVEEFSRLTQLSNPIPYRKSMYVDEAYRFLNTIIKHLRHKETLSHQQAKRLIIRAMENING